MDADFPEDPAPLHVQQVLYPRSPKEHQDYCMQPAYMVRESPRLEHVGSQQPAASCVITTGSPAGADIAMNTPQASESASMLERFLSPETAAKKKTNSMQRKLADLLGPLLAGRGSKAPSPRAVYPSSSESSPVVASTGQYTSAFATGLSPRTAAAVAQSPMPMMISPRMPAPGATMSSDYTNMEMSSDGARSKKSSAESNLSTLSSSNSATTLQTSSSMTHAQLLGSTTPNTPISNGAKGEPAVITPQLDLLLRAARHCALPASPRAAPAPGSPAGSPNQTTMLAVSNTLPPRMQRVNWSLADYNIGVRLYKGYASRVHIAQCKRTGEVVVLKVYTLAKVCDLYKYQIYREVRVHASLDHEHVIKLYAAFQEGDQIILVQEFADGADLFTLLSRHGGRMAEHQAVRLVLEPFLNVLQYLHSRGIVHRDIKPENILFKRNYMLKLGDFGLAIDLHDERPVTRAGTLDYMAPEVLQCPYKSRPEENKDVPAFHYSSRVDSWAVGILAFELLAGYPPFFDQEDRKATERHIFERQPEFPSNMSEQAKSFIARALNKNSAQRPTIYEMLAHPWMEQHRGRRSARTPTTSFPEPLHTTFNPSLHVPSDASVAVATTNTQQAPTVMQMAYNKVHQQLPTRVVPHVVMPGSLHTQASLPQMMPGGHMMNMSQSELNSSLPSVPLTTMQQFATPFATIPKAMAGLKQHQYVTPSRLAPPPMAQMHNPVTTFTMPVTGQRVPTGDAAVYVGAYGKAAPPTAQVMGRMASPAGETSKPYQLAGEPAKPYQQMQPYTPATSTMQNPTQA